MKALLIALTTVGSATASAQPSVTVFGSVDLNVTYAKAASRSSLGMEQGGHMLPSRFGLRGVEELGNGVQAAFWLESAVLHDTGQGQGPGPLWGRRATVGLVGKGLGEFRVGRDYVPTFWNVSSFSPFGTVGVGGSSNLIRGWPFGLGEAKTQTRASNQVTYFLPRMRGVYGQLTAATGEGVDGAPYVGGRLGYQSGPLDIAVGYGTTPVGAADYKVMTVGGSYDFGVVKAFANVYAQRLAVDKQRHVMVGASVPFGLGQIKASFARSDRSGPGVDADDAKQFAVGYSHLLSKRTSLYGACSTIVNEGNAAHVTADSSPSGLAGQRSSGLQFGLRHDF